MPAKVGYIIKPAKLRTKNRMQSKNGNTHNTSLSIYHDSTWHNQTVLGNLRYLRKLQRTNLEMVLLILIIYHCMIYMEVSWNKGTPKSSILVGFPPMNQPFGSTPMTMETPYTGDWDHSCMDNWIKPSMLLQPVSPVSKTSLGNRDMVWSQKLKKKHVALSGLFHELSWISKMVGFPFRHRGTPPVIIHLSRRFSIIKPAHLACHNI